MTALKILDTHDTFHYFANTVCDKENKSNNDYFYIDCNFLFLLACVVTVH